MKRIAEPTILAISFLVLTLLASCAVSNKSVPRSSKFKCNLAKHEFLEQSEGILLESNFKVTSLDINKGEIIASNKKRIGKAEVMLEVIAKISEESQSAETFAKFTTTTDGKSETAYYVGDDVPPEYQEMYLQSVSLLKLLCNNPKYPNR